MSEIQKRIIEFIELIKINENAFSLNIGMSRGYVRSIKEEISTRVLRNIIRAYPGLNIYWLITGEGEILRTELNNETLVTELNSIELLNRLERKDQEIGRLQAKIEAYEGKRSSQPA